MDMNEYLAAQGMKFLNVMDEFLVSLKPTTRLMITYKDGQWSGDVTNNEEGVCYGAYGYQSLRRLIDALNIVRDR